MYSPERITSTVSIASAQTINQAAALELIRHAGLNSRTDFAHRLKISPPTVKRIVDELMAEDLVHSAAQKVWSGVGATWFKMAYSPVSG